jgi:capsid protein
VDVPLGVTNTGFTGTRRVEELAPGSELGGLAGEEIAPWQPNIPNDTFFPHAKLILTIIGCNIGMPIVLTLLDASETNFSGWRGAVDQARLGFRDNQSILVVRFHRPYWRNKINHWADADAAMAAHREKHGARFFKHDWRRPGWPYIEPVKDRTADLIGDSSMQTSPRRRCTERGNGEWPEIVRETIEDRALAIRSALEEAKKLNTENMLQGSDVVSWRDLAPLPTPERVTVALSGEEPKDDAKPNPKPAA